ncbi:alpha/beta hydrolase [Halorubellus sp. PRR65]|uniref:alpha/beta fold hydrolase n=1 Tax=Halorubellus sp. PRR65 TaxID=3098148 RepID=UPI002B2569D9|nr:alpha/beta hydrolase [Halorubellus sp. PRR65]
MVPSAGSGTDRYRTRADTVATDRGDGPPVVLAHGTLMDRTMFDPQVDALADDHRVVAYDLRARTDRYADSYDLYDLADDCAALMDAKGIDSCVLGGMSMGGFMALRFAERYPERVDGLVLVSTTAGPHGEEETARYEEMIATARDADAVPEHLADVIKHILFGATTNEERSALVDAWVDRWLTYPGEGVYQEVRSWLHRPDFTEQLAGVDVPALVVHGEEDVALEPERSEPLAEALDARRVTVPGAGHSVNLERPAPVNDAVREFLADVR